MSASTATRAPLATLLLIVASYLHTGICHAGAEQSTTPLSEQLITMPLADLSGLEAPIAAAIRQARQQLNTLLSNANGEAGQLADHPLDHSTGRHPKPAPGSPMVPSRSALADAYARLAALYQHANIDGAAADAWQNAATLQPQDYRWRYYQGWLALNNGDIAQALTAFQQASERNPGYAPLALRLGQCWLANNQIDRAQAALLRAARQPGLRAAALYHLAQIALLQRDYPLALKQLQNAQQLAPHASSLHYPLAQALRGVGQRKQAREQLALVPPGTPQPPAADDPLVADLNQAVQSAQADFNHAMQAVRKRDYPTALQRFAAGLAIDPDNYHARSSYARALWLDGKTEQARRQLRQVLAQHPQDALASFMLALMVQHAGDDEQAMSLYQQTLKIDSQHQGAHYYLAQLLYTHGDFPAAADHYRAAQHGDSALPAARLLALLAAYHAEPDSAAAIARQLDQLLERYPQQAELRYARIRLYALSTDPAIHNDVAAVTLANQLLKDHPGPAPLQALALAVAANGQFGIAADIQQQLIDQLQWSADAEQLGDMQQTLNNYQSDTMPSQAVWPLNDPMLQPPPFDARAPIREYLTPTPF